ncbi:hypothetical protein Fmac_028409 [Flemingia macrophylla]|uniref:Uncharacterized protein n=1 Tax=Flemingia macrophylla TaxID=520843 RepID=A0ABD1L7E3_9FABA
MDSFSSISKSSYLCANKLSLLPFTSVDPSYVNAKVSHICFALLKLSTFVY